MKNKLIVLFCILFSYSVVAKDRLEVYEDYELGTEIMALTTVKIDPNMGDVYLAGLRESWVKAMKFKRNWVSSKTGKYTVVILLSVVTSICY